MNQATQLGQQSGGALNPMAMALALRKKDPKNATKPAPIIDKSEMMPNSDPAYNNLF
jgi:hypothetical protein